MMQPPSVILPPRLGLELMMGVTGLVDLQDGERLGNVERDTYKVKARLSCNPLVNYMLGTYGEIKRVMYNRKKRNN
jgi:hypothetical protein